MLKTFLLKRSSVINFSERLKVQIILSRGKESQILSLQNISFHFWMQDDKSPLVLFIYPKVNFKSFSQVTHTGMRVNPRRLTRVLSNRTPTTYYPERGMNDILLWLPLCLLDLILTYHSVFEIASYYCKDQSSLPLLSLSSIPLYVCMYHHYSLINGYLGCF